MTRRNDLGFDASVFGLDVGEDILGIKVARLEKAALGLNSRADEFGIKAKGAFESRALGIQPFDEFIGTKGLLAPDKTAVGLNPIMEDFGLKAMRLVERRALGIQPIDKMSGSKGSRTLLYRRGLIRVACATDR